MYSGSKYRKYIVDKNTSSAWLGNRWKTSSYINSIYSVQNKSHRWKLQCNLLLRVKHPLIQHIPYVLKQVSDPQKV